MYANTIDNLKSKLNPSVIEEADRLVEIMMMPGEGEDPPTPPPEKPPKKPPEEEN